MSEKKPPPIRRTFDNTGRLVELAIDCTMQPGMTVKRWAELNREKANIPCVFKSGCVKGQECAFQSGKCMHGDEMLQRMQIP